MLSQPAKHGYDEAPDPNLVPSYAALREGQIDEACSLARDVLQAAQGVNLRLEANALAFLAHCDRIGHPRLRRASEASRRAAQIFEQLGDARGEARALTTLAHVTMLLGRNDEAVEAALMAVRLCEDEPGAPAVLAHNVLGLAYSWIGDNERADVSLEAAVQIATGCTPPVSAFQPRLNQMWVEASRLHDQRFETGAIGCLTRLEELARECGELQGNGKGHPVMPGLRGMATTIFHASMAVLAAWKGDVQGARSLIDTAVQSLPRFDSWLSSFIHWCTAELAWTQGDLAAAEAALVLMRDTALAVEHEQMACRAQLLLIQVLKLQGNSGAALEEHRALHRREKRIIEEALRSRESLVTWQLGARQGERKLQEVLTASNEARLASRAKTQFLAAASHDLRQPIHSLNVLVAALGLRELDSGSREIVSLLDTVNQTLLKQLDGLLDISKLDAGAVRPDISNERVDLLVLAQHAMLEPVARELGIALELDVPAEVSVMTDATLFMRMLGNLADNALKFTPSGGIVRLSATGNGALACVSVSDTGVGIPQDDHDRVFEEFYQVGGHERDRSRGLGLGLSIVRRLAELLSVDVGITSRVGEGTEVSLRLKEVRSEPGRHAPPQVQRPTQGLTVLVIDDESLVRESMRLLLLELGCSIHLADGTAEAAEIARCARIDVVLSDCRLRDPDTGLAAIQCVLALHPTASAALVTGDTAVDRIRDAQAAGVPLLYKPVTLQDLLSVLQAHQPGIASETH